MERAQFRVRFIYVEGPVVDNPQPRIDDHDRARVRPLPNNETTISSVLHMMYPLRVPVSLWSTRKENHNDLPLYVATRKIGK